MEHFLLLHEPNFVDPSYFHFFLFLGRTFLEFFQYFCYYGCYWCDFSNRPFWKCLFTKFTFMIIMTFMNSINVPSQNYCGSKMFKTNIAFKISLSFMNKTDVKNVMPKKHSKSTHKYYAKIFDEETGIGFFEHWDDDFKILPLIENQITLKCYSWIWIYELPS